MKRSTRYQQAWPGLCLVIVFSLGWCVDFQLAIGGCDGKGLASDGCADVVACITDSDSDPDEQIHNPLPGEGLVSDLLGVPNPANPLTNIQFTLESASKVDVQIFDISGRLVKRLLQGAYLPAGPAAFSWSGTDEQGQAVASGTYLLQVKAGKFITSQRITLVR